MDVQVVICYDTSNDKLRYRLVKYLERMAVRIQYSVFYGDLQAKQIDVLQQFVEMLFQSYDDPNASFLVFPIKDAAWKNKPQIPLDYLYV